MRIRRVALVVLVTISVSYVLWQVEWAGNNAPPVKWNDGAPTSTTDSEQVHEGQEVTICADYRNHAQKRQWCKVGARKHADVMEDGSVECVVSCLPSVVIVGASAGGTSFLKVLLRQYEADVTGESVHPFSVPTSEIHFVDYKPAYNRTNTEIVDRYLKKLNKKLEGGPAVCRMFGACSCVVDLETGCGAARSLVVDKTPNYMALPYAARELGEVINAPDAVFVFVLRNPVERLIGQYAHHQLKQRTIFQHFQRQVERRECYQKCWSKNGIEYMDYLQEMVDLARSTTWLGERAPLSQEIEDLKVKCRTACRITGKHRLYSPFQQYVEKSIYIEQVIPFVQQFRRDQLVFIKSETLFHNPSMELRRVLEAVGMPVNVRSLDELDAAPAINQHASVQPIEVTEEERMQMAEFFSPFNKLLGEMLELDLRDWGTSADL